MRIKTSITSALLVDFPTPSLPVFLVLEPLRKRFLFHFRGAKETNRPDKPEWMFTQILTWIKDHELFLTDWMQPVYAGFLASVKVRSAILLKVYRSDFLHVYVRERFSTGLNFDATLDRFSRAPQIFPKFLQSSCAIFLCNYLKLPYNFL